MDTVIRFWGYLTDAGTAVPAIVGMVAGFSIGFFLSRPCWDFIAEGRRLKREDREAERTRKAAVYGFLWDRDGNPYCPTCGTLMQPFIKNHQGVLASFCPTCDKDKPGRGDHYCFLPEGKDLMEEVRKAFQKR